MQSLYASQRTRKTSCNTRELCTKRTQHPLYIYLVAAVMKVPQSCKFLFASTGVEYFVLNYWVLSCDLLYHVVHVKQYCSTCMFFRSDNYIFTSGCGICFLNSMYGHSECSEDVRIPAPANFSLSRAVMRFMCVFFSRLSCTCFVAMRRQNLLRS